MRRYMSVAPERHCIQRHSSSRLRHDSRWRQDKKKKAASDDAAFFPRPRLELYAEVDRDQHRRLAFGGDVMQTRFDECAEAGERNVEARAHIETEFRGRARAIDIRTHVVQTETADEVTHRHGHAGERRVHRAAENARVVAVEQSLEGQLTPHALDAHAER